MPNLFTNGSARGSRRPALALALLTLALALPLLFVGNALAAQATVPLGDAATFGALSATAMTNTGLDTVVNGDVGSSTSIGAGVTHPGHSAYGAGSAQLANAQASLLTAYGNAEAQTPTGNITGQNLAGQMLTPGVYNSTGGILIDGPTALTLNGGGNPDAVFIFQAAASGDLTVNPTSNIVFTNGAQPCNVFWKVNSAFLKNTGFTFVGTILALTQITLTDSITVEGRVLARNADVTFIHDVVNVPTTCATTTAPPAPVAIAPNVPDNSLLLAQAAAAKAASAAKAAAAAAAAAQAAADQAAAVAAAKVAADQAAIAAAAAAQAQAAAAAAANQAAVAAAATAAKAAAAKAAASAKVAKAAASSRTHAMPARRHVGLTG